MELTAGKVAVVTGAASGIGLALAERFACAGLDVVLADVEQTALRAAAQRVAGLIPAASPSYDPAKHAVVAISEDLYKAMKVAGLPVGVSVLTEGTGAAM